MRCEYIDDPVHPMVKIIKSPTDHEVVSLEDFLEHPPHSFRAKQDVINGLMDAHWKRIEHLAKEAGVDF